MPMIDMPVEELERYQGRNPRPEDFDEYWENALEEMRHTNPNVIMEKADFQVPGAECYDMYFTGVNGARIYVKHLRPKNLTEKCSAVLLFHGYSGSSENWSDKLAYVAAGSAVFALDVRGQAGKSMDVGGVRGNTFYGHIIRGLHEDDPQRLLFRDIFLDTAQLAKIVLELDFVDETNVYARGVSQGGGLTIACAALEPRIAKAFSVSPFLCDYKRVWEMDLDVDAYLELKQYFRNFDPRHEWEQEVFCKLGYIDLQYLAPRIKAETWMATGLLDTACPPSTQYAAYNKMTCKKKHILYPDFAHEILNGVEDIAFQFFYGEGNI